MATVNSDILLLTVAGVKTEFDAAYIKAQANADWQNVATQIDTTLPIQNYAWLGRGAIMSPFEDETDDQSVRENSYTIADTIYKGQLTIERKSIEDDQYGLIMMRVRQLANEPVRAWNQLAITTLMSGFTNLCYDGLSMFNASHTEGSSGTQNNTTSASLSDTALQTAESTMRALVDDKGIPLEIEPDTLVVGPALARLASDLIGSGIVVSRVGDGTAGSGATSSTSFDNYFKGRFKLVVSSYLVNGTFGRGRNKTTYTGAYNWFLMDTKREIKPIVIQSRSDVPITLETDMDEPNAKIKEEYRFTARGRFNSGYGLWQTVYGSSATA